VLDEKALVKFDVAPLRGIEQSTGEVLRSPYDKFIDLRLLLRDLLNLRSPTFVRLLGWAGMRMVGMGAAVYVYSIICQVHWSNDSIIPIVIFSS